MQDKNLPEISDTFRGFIEVFVEDVVFYGANFNVQKRWLQKYCEAEGVDYDTLKNNLMDFCIAMEEWKSMRLKSSEMVIRTLAKDCYLSESVINRFLDNVAKGTPQQETERNDSEERECKAKEEAKHQEKMRKAEDLFQRWVNYYPLDTRLDKEKLEKRIPLLMKSAALGYPKAQNNLSTAYVNGMGVEKDEKEAFRLAMASALQDNPGGQYLVGEYYLNGIGVEPNDEFAFMWLYKSAQAGNPLGMTYLAICYRYGIGTAIDLEQAERLVSKAKEINPERASHYARIMELITYESIKSVRQNREEL